MRYQLSVDQQHYFIITFHREFAITNSAKKSHGVTRVSENKPCLTSENGIQIVQPLYHEFRNFLTLTICQPCQHAEGSPSRDVIDFPHIEAIHRRYIARAFFNDDLFAQNQTNCNGKLSHDCAVTLGITGSRYTAACTPSMYASVCSSGSSWVRLASAALMRRSSSDLLIGFVKKSFVPASTARSISWC